MRFAFTRVLPVAALVLPVFLLSGGGQAEARRSTDAQVRSAVHSRTAAPAARHTVHRASRQGARVAQAHRRATAAAQPAS